MSNMKCPFCNTPLVHENMSDYWCVHCNTQEQKGLYGSNKLWQELIRTRKALEIAVDALKGMNGIIKNYEYGNGLYYALDGHDTMLIAEDVEKALYQITALEQKE